MLAEEWMGKEHDEGGNCRCGLARRGAMEGQEAGAVGKLCTHEMGRGSRRTGRLVVRMTSTVRVVGGGRL